MTDLRDASIKPVHRDTYFSGSTPVSTEYSATTTRSLGRLYGDMIVNVKTFGATGNGSHDDTAAIQAAVDWTSTSTSRGIIWFPIGRYVISSPINLETVTGSLTIDKAAHNCFRLMGAGGDGSNEGGSLLIGDFAGFILLKESAYQSGAANVIEGLTLKQNNSAGGVAYISGRSHVVFRDCAIYSNCYGIIFDQMNASHGIQNCSLRSSGNPLNSIGVSIGGTGGFVRDCDFVGWDHAIRFTQVGNTVSSCRIEVNRKGIVPGSDPQDQMILSTAASPTGGWTRLTLTSSIMYTANALAGLGAGQIMIGNAFGTPGLNGVWVPTWIDSTHVDIHVAWVAGDTLQATIGSFRGQAPGQGAIEGCSFEGNDFGMYMHSFLGFVTGCNFLGHYQGPSGQSIAGLYVRSCTNSLFAGVTGSGGFSVAGCYLDPDGTKYSNTFLGCNFGTNLVLTGGPYTNTVGPYTVKRGTSTLFPSWLVVGVKVTGSTVVAGTTVAAINSAAGTFTLSAPNVGTLTTTPFEPPFTFYDPVSGFLLGGFDCTVPSGNANAGMGLISRISASTTLGYSHFEDIELNPGGGTIALTIDNDASFGAPSHGNLYRITQTGTGTANITAGTATVNGVTGTVVAMAVGGQYKSVILRYVGTDKWYVYVG